MLSDKRRDSVALSASTRPVIEALEGRALFSLSFPTAPSLLPGMYRTLSAAPQADSITPQAVGESPTITNSRPGPGATNVLRDAHITADVRLPNSGHGVDESTLTSATVKLYRTTAGTPVTADLDTTGGGDAIILQPHALLAANTSYTFEITSGVKDTSGASFTPYKIKFNTGSATSTTPTTASFAKTALPITGGQKWTGLAFGPDGKLYASTLAGKIYRYTVDAAGGLSDAELIDTVRNNNGGNRLISGMAFDPASTASNLILWVSHSQSTLENASDWQGKVSRLSGANLDGYRDVVVGLPRSIRDHVTNQPTFGPDGALYLNQGSMSAMGAPDNAWGNRSEHLLSGAILRIDTKAISGTLNVKTESGGTYNPFASGAPVTIYAEGVRNAYDGVWHRNGHYFVPANGSAAGGSTPSGGGVGALSDIQETQADFLFDIKKGGYYGHPNPKLGNYVLNGGNPTSGIDENEIARYPVGTQPDSNYRGDVYNFGKNYSANGIIEYQGNAFSGTLDGKLLVVRYSGGDDIVILTPDKNGNIVATEKGGPGLTGFNDPLDLVQDPRTGFIYVAEHGGERITLLTPNPTFSFNKEQLVFSDIKGGSASAAQTVTFTNTSGKSITIPSDGITLTGGNAPQFVITSKPSSSLTLAAGQSFTVGVQFAASSSTSFGIKVAALSVRTTQGTPPLEIALRGLALEGSGGASEPSLQKVLDLFRVGATVGDSNVEDSSLQNPPTTPNDEVAGQRFFKAGSGNVTIEPITFFSPTSTPTVRAGWYRSGDTNSKTELFTVASQYAQSVAPVASGSTSFDPGMASFGLYTEWPSQSGRRVWSEHALNTWEPNAALRQKVRVYPLKTAEGNVVPNAFVVGFEEIPGTISDYQDGVFIIRNVTLDQPLAATPKITHVKLVDADTGVITSSLNNGMTLNLANTPRISVQALVGEGVGSVRFQVDGKTFRIENSAPYMINGDDNDTGLPHAWTPSVGQHVLRITPYSGAGASGVMGAARVLTINVTNGAQPGELFRQFINFQPDGAPVPAGYRADIGRVFGLRKNGLTYGWSEPNEANMVDRDDLTAVDQRFDTFGEVGDRTWSIKVPNGTYSVYVNCSDPSNINAKYGIMVQDTRAVWAVPTETEPWGAGTVTVQVTDGILRVTRAIGSRNNKLAFIQISQLS